MKTEHRHQLETNWLASHLARWIEKFKPYTGSLIGGLVVLCGIAVVSSFWAAQSADQRQAAWDDFAIARDTTDIELTNLRELADEDKYSGTPMQEWAYVTWADRQVLLASGEYLINRESSKDRLRLVVGIYEGLVEGAVDTVVQNRARFGLARVFELQNKLEEARQQYSLVQGDLQPIATHRAEQLDSSKVQETCAWLASAELPQRSVGGQFGALPNFDASLPATTPPGSSQKSAPSDTRTLEEILDTAGTDAGSEDRYTTEDAKEDAGESEEEKAEASSDSPQPDSPPDDEPAESEAGESADSVEEVEAEAKPAEEAETKTESETAEEVETETDADAAE